MKLFRACSTSSITRQERKVDRACDADVGIRDFFRNSHSSCVESVSRMFDTLTIYCNGRSASLKQKLRYYIYFEPFIPAILNRMFDNVSSEAEDYLPLDDPPQFKHCLRTSHVHSAWL